jgi:hypothetical protein
MMRAAAHNPEFAKKVGVPVGVAQEFAEADKGKKFGTGGRPDRQKINKPKTRHGDMAFFKEGGLMAKKEFPLSQGMGKVKTAAPSRDGIAERGKTKGKQIKMAGDTIGTSKAKKK